MGMVPWTEDDDQTRIDSWNPADMRTMQPAGGGSELNPVTLKGCAGSPRRARDTLRTTTAPSRRSSVGYVRRERASTGAPFARGRFSMVGPLGTPTNSPRLLKP